MNEPQVKTSTDGETAIKLIERIVHECPRRVAGSVSEARALDILREQFDELDLKTRFHEFRFNTSLYALMALHFGLAIVGTALFYISPAVALGVHLLAAISYFADSQRWFIWLRRLFPWVPSKNLLATAPAVGEPKLRIALIAHADAAFTGLMFNPEMIKRGTTPPPIPGFGFMRKGMMVATASVLILAALDLIAVLNGGASTAIAIAVGVVSLPALLVFLLNIEVVIRNEVVPGANDNLTGCAGVIALARRLADRKPDNVELVFVCTGAEEAGTGGARALADEVSRGAWGRENTVILGVDGLSNGRLRYMQDGEIIAMPMAPWLVESIEKVAASSPTFSEVCHFEIPCGASDASPFIAAGYDGICIGCIDPEIGAPLHYHHPTDTPENLDADQIGICLDYIEALVLEIIQQRTAD
jgi:hypothetical protein